MSRRLRQQRGFSLLEVLIAFTILAISLSVILNIFATGVRAAILSEEYTIAVQIAESLLAKTVKETRLSEAGATADDYKDKFKAQVDVAPIDLGIEGLDPDTTTWEAFQVRVRVYWMTGNNEREVVLQTLRLAAKEQ